MVVVVVLVVLLLVVVVLVVVVVVVVVVLVVLLVVVVLVVVVLVVLLVVVVLMLLLQCIAMLPGTQYFAGLPLQQEPSLACLVPTFCEPWIPTVSICHIIKCQNLSNHYQWLHNV